METELRTEKLSSNLEEQGLLDGGPGKLALPFLETLPTTNFTKTENNVSKSYTQNLMDNQILSSKKKTDRSRPERIKLRCCHVLRDARTRVLNDTLEQNQFKICAELTQKLPAFQQISCTNIARSLSRPNACVVKPPKSKGFRAARQELRKNSKVPVALPENPLIFGGGKC
jgi:hypothetical protein